jgi:Flp pilus assembly protein TadD
MNPNTHFSRIASLSTREVTPAAFASRTPRRSLVAAALAACFVGQAAVAGPLPRFEMQAALDATGGAEILRGDYTEALAALDKARSGIPPEWRIGRAINACVAQTLSGNRAAGPGACTDAVDMASTAAVLPYHSLRQHKERLAIVHANRAVAYWRAGDVAAAAADLERAQAFDPRSAAVMTNVEAFTARRDAYAANSPYAANSR